MGRKTYDQLRSARWFAPDDFRSFGHRSRAMQMGLGAGGLGRQAGRRHPQHLVRAQSLPCPFQAARRGCEARRAPGRRPAGRIAGAFALRKLRQADDDALSQHAGDGDGGAASLASGRRRGADGRLRQDHAGPRHGRGLGRLSDDLPAGRTDAARQLQGRSARLRLGCVQILGRTPRRHHHQGTMDGRRRRHRALLRPLHDHGHGQHHDRDRRGDGALPARRQLDPRRRRQPYPHELGRRPPDRRHDLGGPHAGQDHHARSRSRTPSPSPWRPAARPTP